MHSKECKRNRFIALFSWFSFLLFSFGLFHCFLADGKEEGEMEEEFNLKQYTIKKKNLLSARNHVKLSLYMSAFNFTIIFRGRHCC